MRACALLLRIIGLHGGHGVTVHRVRICLEQSLTICHLRFTILRSVAGRLQLFYAAAQLGKLWRGIFGAVSMEDESDLNNQVHFTLYPFPCVLVHFFLCDIRGDGAATTKHATVWDVYGRDISLARRRSVFDRTTSLRAYLLEPRIFENVYNAL